MSRSAASLGLTAADKYYDGAANAAVMAAMAGRRGRVLDIGCGGGTHARHMREMGMRADGVTISQAEAQRAAEWCERVWVHDVERGLPGDVTGPYDTVLCSHVLEHICFPAALLAAIRGVLAPGGELVIAIPNLLYYKNRVRLARGEFRYEPWGIMDDTHFRWYTFTTMQELLREHGYHVTRAWADGSFPLYPLRRVLPGVAKVIDKLASRAVPGLFGQQLLFRARIG
jgi:2-polyprenyl-3-methyl-5-hydroxy-6-metoxy-1,4-benzoquinol methylase